MIRVNLLPVRAARKKENIRRQISIFFLSLFFGLCVMGYLWFDLRQSIKEKERQIENAQKELAELEAIIKQVNEIKAKLATLEAKMDVIQKLEENRTASVRIMDALTSLVVARKMWLTSLTETGGEMNLVGVAVDNKTIADFMTRLEGSSYFGKVDLISSQQVQLAPDRKFKGFNITCQALALQPPQ